MTIFSVFGAAAWWVVVASACWTLKAPAPIVARIASEFEIFPEVLHSAVSMHSERALRGGVELTLTTEPKEITIVADSRRIRQVVFNLVSNAVKFTPREGRIDVSARLDDGQVEIAVADTGPGIASEDLETIFEEFKQATDGKRAEGTGLGLPLSRRLVELHGGRLWVESEPGRGSTFRFTLPVGPTEPALAHGTVPDALDTIA
jgi:signal transduction histidine kinase